MFGEFNEATQLKTSSAKYSIEFNDLAVRQTLHTTVCEKVCGQTNVAIEVHDHYTTPPFIRHLLVFFSKRLNVWRFFYIRSFTFWDNQTSQKLIVDVVPLALLFDLTTRRDILNNNNNKNQKYVEQ